MFHQLLESGSRPARPPGWTFASAGVHAACIGLATVLTLREVRPVGAPESVRDVFWPQPAPRVLPRESGATTTQAPGPAAIPIAIPDIPGVVLPEATLPLTAATDFQGPGIFRDAFSRVSDLRTSDAGAPYSQHHVDRAVVPLRGNPSPEYPQTLRGAMVEGSVLVQFVVDSTGRVEPQSVAILRSSHALFELSARRWLARTRYQPAQVRGGPVRQLVQQQIEFTLTP